LRKFAISDIHGCRKSFAALLDKIKFTTDDVLYLLGDYIDRGPDSKGVIDLIWQLQTSGHAIYCLKGNHEEMLLDDYGETYRDKNLGDEALRSSFNVNYVQDVPANYLRWMNTLPHYLEVDNYLLVHAGFEFTFPDPLIDKDAMLWIRKWYSRINRDWLTGRIIVHGHTPTLIEEIEHAVTDTTTLPAIAIDNGCVFHHIDGLGQLCALELGTQRLSFQEYIG
jgi:serine/threonine protein phosphatase 1